MPCLQQHQQPKAVPELITRHATASAKQLAGQHIHTPVSHQPRPSTTPQAVKKVARIFSKGIASGCHVGRSKLAG